MNGSLDNPLLQRKEYGSNRKTSCFKIRSWIWLPEGVGITLTIAVGHVGFPNANIFKTGVLQKLLSDIWEAGEVRAFGPV